MNEDELMALIGLLRLQVAELKSSKARLRELLESAQKSVEGKCMRMAIEYGDDGSFSIIICGANDEDERTAMDLLVERMKALGLTGAGPLRMTGQDPKP